MAEHRLMTKMPARNWSIPQLSRGDISMVDAWCATSGIGVRFSFAAQNARCAMRDARCAMRVFRLPVQVAWLDATNVDVEVRFFAGRPRCLVGGRRPS